MKFIVTGGGTGGHIYPAISIYNRVLEDFENSEAMYIGSKFGIEHDVLSGTAINYKEISARGFERGDKLYSFVSLFYLIKAFFQALFIILRYKPALVMGMGGFVSAPVVIAAWFCRVPTVIHEQNAFPGLTTRFLAKFSKKILYSFDECVKHLSKHEKKMIKTGNPVRTEFLRVDRAEERKALGLAEDDILILSFGGSNGSKPINDLSFELLELTHKYPKLSVIHICGKFYEEVYKRELEGRDENTRFKLLVYGNEMYKLFASADLLISRAGATTIAEMEAVRLPAVLIPSPYVANNHQFYNAQSYIESKACIVLEEKDIDIKEFGALIGGLCENRAVLEEMRAAYGTWDRDVAMKKILEVISVFF